MAQAKKTATYRVVTDAGGGRSFRFYCDLSGELCCVTKPLRADTEQAALALAWETEGRWHFNRCPACGRAAGMSPPPCSTSTRGGAWTVRRGRASTPRSATTAASACGNRTPASAPSAGRDCRWAAQTERRKPPNDRL